MNCEKCMCKNCVHHNRGCADCDICEDEDMTVWGCNQYERDETKMKEYLVNITETMTKTVIIRIPENMSIEAFYDDINDDVNEGINGMNIEDNDSCIFSRDWKVVPVKPTKNDRKYLRIIKYGKDDNAND